MEERFFKQTRQHFSKLGMMYFCGSLIFLAVQLGVVELFKVFWPTLLYHADSSFLISMLPVYGIAMPLTYVLIRMVPANRIQPHRMSIQQWLVAFLMCYACMYVGNLFGQAITLIIGEIKGAPVVNTVTEISMEISPWVSILVMVILAPVAEELLFRKFLIDRTVKYGEGVAVLLSGVMFGLFHGNLNQFCYAFVIGLFFGFIYVKTGMIRYTIFLHMGINFLGSVASVLFLQYAGYDKLLAAGNPRAQMEVVAEYLPQMMLYAVYVMLLLTVAVIGVVLLILNLKRKKFVCGPGEVTLPKGKRFVLTVGNVGMILFAVFWLVQIVLQLIG